MFFMVPMKCQIARRERGRREMGGSGVARRNLIRSAGFPSHFLGWVGDCVLWCVGGGEEGGRGRTPQQLLAPGKERGREKRRPNIIDYSPSLSLSQWERGEESMVWCLFATPLI